MNIEIGWGSREITFVPSDGHRMAHLSWRFIERGGHGAEPTGIAYSWWSEPATLPALIAELQEIHSQYLEWIDRERARFAAQSAEAAPSPGAAA